jgi:predicted DNA-binding transcriptional regulator AlpA
MDRLLKRKELCVILNIKDTKLREMIKKNKLIEPIYIEGFSEPLFSEIELQEWIEIQKSKRRTPSYSSANIQERA